MYSSVDIYITNHSNSRVIFIILQRYNNSSANMNTNQRILIKDPYLNTTYKSDIPQRNTYTSLPKEQIKEFTDNSKWKIEQDMRRELERTRNQFKRMARAYTEENSLNKKILGYQAVNNEYHQALKMRNLDLNNRLTDIATQNHLMANRFEEDSMRNYHEKDLILRKFEGQAEQLVQAKRTINNLLEVKTKMEQELEYLRFQLQKQTDRFNLQMREQLIRMEGLERSLKTLSEVKDQEITQLRHRVRVYEDENKRLNDENRSLHITNASQRQKQNRGGIENLSQIHHLDSQTKQLKDPNGRTFTKQLNEQKNINEKLQKQIDDLKRKLFEKEESTNNRGKSQVHNDNENKKSRSPSKEKIRSSKGNQLIISGQFENVNPQGLINTVQTLRNGINKEIFEVFYKSVKDGEKNRSNSLVIFMENWKLLDLERIHPYIISYFEARNTLQQICQSNKYKGKPINQKMEECIPLRIAFKKGRNEINIWILSTIQFTKNQRESSKKSMNNLLLFLFRLLTIQYRIIYPMQGKSYTIDADVRNQLYHQIVKAVNFIIQFH